MKPIKRGGIKKKKKFESHETENYGPFLFENGQEGRKFTSGRQDRRENDH